MIQDKGQFFMVRLPLTDEQERTACDNYMDGTNDLNEFVRAIGTPIPPCAEVETVGYVSAEDIPNRYRYKVSMSGTQTGMRDTALIRRTDMEAQAEVSEALIRGLKAEISRYRKALNDISENITCGCMPCMGNCWDTDSLRDEISERAEIARMALNEGSVAGERA